MAQRRNDYRAGRLTPYQAAELEALPGWLWNPRQQRWEHGVAALESYLALHDHSNVPRDAVLDGYPLGRWVHARRRQHQLGTLPAARIAELEALPGWRWIADY